MMLKRSRPAAVAADRALGEPRGQATVGSVARATRVRIDWSGILGDVARALLGDPNSRLSRGDEWRYRARGSLALHVAGERAGYWCDFETDEGGGVLALVMREHGCDRAGAMAWLQARGFFGNAGEKREFVRCEPLSDSNPCRTPRTATGGRRDTRAAARQVWEEARPLAGTVAEAYLDGRRVAHVTGAPALRFHPALGHPTARGRWACLVAGVQDVNGRYIGVQRTYLNGPHKAAVEPVRASLGSLRGGAVRLGEPRDGCLLLGEGIESTAAAVRLFDWRGGAWATLGTPGLRAVELSESVQFVAIAADRDPKGDGQLAAAALAERLEAEGRHVSIHFSHDFAVFGDFAGALMEAAQ